MRLSSRESSPAKDLGFKSDAALGVGGFQKALCVLQRHKSRGARRENHRSLSMSDSEEFYELGSEEDFKKKPRPSSASAADTAVRRRRLEALASGGPNPSNTINYRRSIHSDSDYVWQYCPRDDGLDSPIRTAPAAASGTTGEPEDTFSSAPTSYNDLSTSKISVRSQSPPLEVIKSFIASPSSSQTELFDEAFLLGGLTSRDHDNQLRGSHDSGVGVSPVDESLHNTHVPSLTAEHLHRQSSIDGGKLWFIENWL